MNNRHLGGLPQGIIATVGLMLVFGGTALLVWRCGKGDPAPLFLAAVASGALAAFSVWQLGERAKQRAHAMVAESRR